MQQSKSVERVISDRQSAGQESAPGDGEGQSAGPGRGALDPVVPDSTAAKYHIIGRDKEADYAKIGQAAAGARKSQTESLFPETHAFLVENRLRQTIEELMEPVVALNHSHGQQLTELKDCFKSFEHTQEKIKAKLEDTELLREMFLEYELKNRKMYNDYCAKTDTMRKQLADTVQLTKVHEDKMSRLTDEIKRMDNIREQMQAEIKEFELLCQDISKDCSLVVHDVRTDFTQKFDDCKFGIDELKYESRDLKSLFRNQKALYQQLDGHLGWQKYNIDELLKITEDLPVLYTQVTSSEHYLHKVLPIKIQAEIFANCKPLVTKDKELRLDFLEHQESAFEELLLNFEKKGTFDKSKYKVPDFQQDLKNARQANRASVRRKDSGSEGAAGDSQERRSDRSEDEAEGESDDASSGSGDGPSMPGQKVNVDALVDSVLDKMLSDEDLLFDLAEALGSVGFGMGGYGGQGAKSSNKKQSARRRGSNSRSIGHASSSKRKPAEQPKLPGGPESLHASTHSRPGLDRSARTSARGQSSRERHNATDLQSKLDGSLQASVDDQEQEAQRKEQQQRQRLERAEAERERGEQMKQRKERREMDEWRQNKDREEARKTYQGDGRGRDDRQSRVRVLPPGFDGGPSPQGHRNRATESGSPARARATGITNNHERRTTLRQSGDPSRSLLFQNLNQGLTQLKDKMRVVNKKLRIRAASDDGEESGEGVLSGEDDKSSISGDKSDESEVMVTHGEFKRAFEQVQDLKKSVAGFKTKLQAFEKDLVGGQGSEDAELSHTASLKAFHKNLKNIEMKFVEKIEHVELLKHEMKNELKRLQRQNFQVTKDFEQQTLRSNHAVEKVLEFNKKILLTDAAMATILKLLRMQYALSHQDERDKQNLFLAGFAEVGQEPAPLDRPGQATAIQANRPGANDKSLSASRRQEAELSQISYIDYIDGAHRRNVHTSSTFDAGTSSIDINKSLDELQVQTPTQDTTTSDAQSANIQILYGVSNKRHDAGNAQTVEGVKKVKMRLLDGVKNANGTKLVSFDAKCLQGCDAEGNGKHVTTLMKAFKMACLTYKPSPVIFDQKSFDRSSLIEAQGYLLFLALEHMKHLDFDQVAGNLLAASSESTLQELDAELVRQQESEAGKQGSIPNSKSNSIVYEQRPSFPLLKKHHAVMQSLNEPLASDWHERTTAGDPFRSVDTDRTTTINKSNSNEYLKTPNVNKKLELLSGIHDKKNQSKMTNKHDKIVNFAEYAGGPEQNAALHSLEGSAAQSIALTPSYKQMSSRNADFAAPGSNKRFSRLINPTMQLLPTARLISLSKSKEYAKLASQIPTIFQIQSGKKVLNQSALVDAGITHGGQTPQDQYQENMKHLKTYQKHLKMQKQLKKRSYSRAKAANGTAANHELQADSSVHLQHFDQSVDDGSVISRPARNHKGILYSSVHRLQKNQTAEPAEFGIRNPAAVQFNFKSGPSLDDHTLRADHHTYTQVGSIGSGRERNVLRSQKKHPVLDAAAGGSVSAIKGQAAPKIGRLGGYGLQMQNALTPQGRGGDQGKERGSFALKYGLMSSDLTQMRNNNLEQRKIGAVGAGNWDVLTPRQELTEQPSLVLDHGTRGGRGGKAKLMHECLSSRPIRFATGAKQNSQSHVADAFTQARRAGMPGEGPILAGVQPGNYLMQSHAEIAPDRLARNMLGSHADGMTSPGSTRILARPYQYQGQSGPLLDVAGLDMRKKHNRQIDTTGADGGRVRESAHDEKGWLTHGSLAASKITEANEGSLGATGAFKFSRGDDQQNQSRAGPFVPRSHATNGDGFSPSAYQIMEDTPSYRDSGAMPSLRTPKIDPQQFSPRTSNIC